MNDLRKLRTTLAAATNIFSAPDLRQRGAKVQKIARRLGATPAGFLLHGIVVLTTCFFSVTPGSAQQRPGESYDEYIARHERCVAENMMPDGWLNSTGVDKCERGDVEPPRAPRETRKAPNTLPKRSQDTGNLADTAKVDPAWAGDTRKRISGKKDDTVEVAEMVNNAPYGDGNCQLFRPQANRGKIDWDWVTVTNRCSYPVEFWPASTIPGKNATAFQAARVPGASSISALVRAERLLRLCRGCLGS